MLRLRKAATEKRAPATRDNARGVRRYFQSHDVDRAVAHVGQQPEELGGFRSRSFEWPFLPVEGVAHGPDSTAATPGSVTDRFHQMGYRRLAVGTGHADQGQRLVRAAVTFAGDRPGGLSRFAHLDPADGVIDSCRARGPGDDGAGSPAKRFGNERLTVGVKAVNGHEQVPRANASASPARHPGSRGPTRSRPAAGASSPRARPTDVWTVPSTRRAPVAP